MRYAGDQSAHVQEDLIVKKVLIYILTGSILLLHASLYAENKERYTIKSEDITLEELKNVLGLDIYKYKIKLDLSSEIVVVLRNLISKRDIFRFSPKTINHGENTLLIKFMRENDKIGSALLSKDKTINYAINWNFRDVYSGTMFNFLKDYTSKFFMAKRFEEVLEAKGKLVLIDLHTYQDEREIQIGELFINVQ